VYHKWVYSYKRTTTSLRRAEGPAAIYPAAAAAAISSTHVALAFGILRGDLELEFNYCLEFGFWNLEFVFLAL
jgi:hypothetical protein